MRETLFAGVRELDLDPGLTNAGDHDVAELLVDDGLAELESPVVVLVWLEVTVCESVELVDPLLPESPPYDAVMLWVPTARLEVDPGVANLKVSGVYRVGDNSAFARSLAKLLPIVVHEDGDTLILTADTDP